MKKNNYKIDEYGDILNSFVSKCDENDIWYSLANKTLLSALTNINYFNQDDYLEVFMTLDSYKKFLELYPNDIIDSINKNNFYFTNPFYIVKTLNIVIKIIILVPANVERCENYYTILNYKRQRIGYWVSYNQKEYFLKRMFFKLMAKFNSNITWSEIYANIYDPKFNGYFLIDDLKININKNWIPSLTFKRDKIHFLDIECYTIKESDIFLTKRYGFDWQNEIKIKNEKHGFNWVREVEN